MKWMEYALKHLGPNMMPQRRRKAWKYDGLAERLRKAANTLDRIHKATKDIKLNDKGLPF